MSKRIFFNECKQKRKLKRKRYLNMSLGFTYRYVETSYFSVNKNTRMKYYEYCTVKSVIFKWYLNMSKVFRYAEAYFFSINANKNKIEKKTLFQ